MGDGKQRGQIDQRRQHHHPVLEQCAVSSGLIVSSCPGH
jgi:hypothetical protein